MANTLIQLIVGDWSDDGHGKTDSVFVRSNLSVEETKAAFEKGDKNFKFSSYCSEYEDSNLPKDLVEKLKPFLTKKELSEIYQEYDQNDSLSVSSDEFVYFWIAVARSGNPDLKIKVTKVNSITVDGYDLFY